MAKPAASRMQSPARRSTPDSMALPAVSGSAGCNSYSASYSRSGNTLTVSGLTSTMMLCSMPAGIMQQEGEFKDALGGAESCRIISSKLEINCTLDRLLVFHPK